MGGSARGARRGPASDCRRRIVPFADPIAFHLLAGLQSSARRRRCRSAVARSWSAGPSTPYAPRVKTRRRRFEESTSRSTSRNGSRLAASRERRARLAPRSQAEDAFLYEYDLHRPSMLARARWLGRPWCVEARRAEDRRTGREAQIVFADSIEAADAAVDIDHTREARDGIVEGAYLVGDGHRVLSWRAPGGADAAAVVARRRTRLARRAWYWQRHLDVAALAPARGPPP